MLSGASKDMDASKAAISAMLMVVVEVLCVVGGLYSCSFDALVRDRTAVDSVQGRLVCDVLERWGMSRSDRGGGVGSQLAARSRKMAPKNALQLNDERINGCCLQSRRM